MLTLTFTKPSRVYDTGVLQFCSLTMLLLLLLPYYTPALTRIYSCFVFRSGPEGVVSHEKALFYNIYVILI
jgi:hypothetical protein